MQQEGWPFFFVGGLGAFCVALGLLALMAAQGTLCHLKRREAFGSRRWPRRPVFFFVWGGGGGTLFLFFFFGGDKRGFMRIYWQEAPFLCFSHMGLKGRGEDLQKTSTCVAGVFFVLMWEIGAWVRKLGDLGPWRRRARPQGGLQMRHVRQAKSPLQPDNRSGIVFYNQSSVLIHSQYGYWCTLLQLGFGCARGRKPKYPLLCMHCFLFERTRWG